MNVTKTTRAGKNGKPIACPTCRAVVVVHHFAWSAARCSKCGAHVAKFDWIVEDSRAKGADAVGGSRE